MCIKQKRIINTKEELANHIINDSKRIIYLLESSKQKERLLIYEFVRLQGKYNMHSEEARRLTRLTKEQYSYIMKNYTKLMIKYPDVKGRALRKLEYIKSANIAKIVALKGCETCRLKVCQVLDIKENELCESCKKIVAKYDL